MNIDELLIVEVFALTIYGEARGETVEGQIAVANVIRNRLRLNPSKYTNEKDVCLAPKQFSCWNINDPNRDKMLEVAEQFKADNITNRYLKQAHAIARMSMEGAWIDNTGRALNYMTVDLFYSDKRPKWAAIPKNEPIKIGNHVFFTA